MFAIFLLIMAFSVAGLYAFGWAINNIAELLDRQKSFDHE